MGLGNYSVLHRNTLDGLSETAGDLYLKLCDTFQSHRSPDNERRAFLAAADYDNKVGCTLDYILRRNPVRRLDTETISSLSVFFADRWKHNFMSEPKL